MATVLIVDDEIDVRMLLRTVLEFGDDGLAIVGEASDGLEAISVWHELHGQHVPDVVVLDHRIPGPTGLEVAAQILAEAPDQVVVLLSAFLDDKVCHEASGLGVAACVTKEAVPTLP